MSFFLHLRWGAVMSDEQVFLKNIDLLRKEQPTVALDVTQSSVTRLRICQSKEGELNIFEEQGGKQKTFHSNYNALREANNWFSGVDLSETDVLYVYGVGMGYYYDAAKEWLDEEAGRYLIFIEDDIEVLRLFFSTQKATEILENKQVQVHYFKGFLESEPMMQWLTWFFVLKPVNVSGLLRYQKEKGETYDKIRSKLLHDSVRKSNLAAEFMRFSTGFFKNFFSNILCLPESYHANRMFGAFTGIPAVICGAGPSLNKNIDILSQLTDKALIFSGGSSLNALNSKGIQPHFGAGIDPNPPQYERLLGNTSLELPFFYRGRMFHDAFRLIHGPRLYNNGTGGYFISEWFEEELGIESVVLDEGHNVINFSVELANALGCNPIIFVGMDLSYTGMSQYADGIVKDPRISEREIVHSQGMDHAAFHRDDIYGNPVYTVWKWVTESAWIGDYAYTHPEKTFINATEGGIGFPGVPNAKLFEVANQHLKRKYPLKQRVHSEIQNATMTEVTRERLLELMEEMGESLEACMDLCDDLLGEIGNVRKKVEKGKKVEADLQTGKSSLFEVELTEEVAYRYILSTMCTAATKVMERQYYQVEFDKTLTSDIQRNLKRLEINEKKVLFTKEASRMTKEALDHSIKKHMKGKVAI